MNQVQNIKQFQGAADFRLLRKKLKGGGIGSIIFGLIAVGMGLAFVEDNPVNAILAVIGFFLLIEGVWVLRAPSPRGMIMEGIVMCVIGVMEYRGNIRQCCCWSYWRHLGYCIGYIPAILGNQSF